jgi:hypothetical protein
MDERYGVEEVLVCGEKHSLFSLGVGKENVVISPLRVMINGSNHFMAARLKQPFGRNGEVFVEKESHQEVVSRAETASNCERSLANARAALMSSGVRAW